jgi:hypothetical protein
MNSDPKFWLYGWTVLSCLGATRMNKLELRTKTLEIFGIAIASACVVLVIMIIPMTTDFALGRTSELDFTEYIRWVSVILHPVSNASQVANEQPVETVIYNPFYWLFVGQVWVLSLVSILSMFTGVCDLMILSVKLVFGRVMK